MHDGRDLLREFWKAGVRVIHAGDRFRLEPPGVAPEALRSVLGAHARDVVAVLTTLPAAGRCPICGASNGWGEIDGTTTANCTTCALIAANRILGNSGDLSHELRESAADDSTTHISWDKSPQRKVG